MLGRTRSLSCYLILLALALASAGCGGSASTATTTTVSGQSSPMTVMAGDAPMSSVLSAKVTISAVNFTSGTGSSVALLSQPRTIELTQLGGTQTPLQLASLAFGTYNSVSVTVSAAEIVYIDGSGNVQDVQATIADNGAASINLNPALQVTGTGATDLRLDFDLEKSLDLTNNVVTFTPTIGAAAAVVAQDSANNRTLWITGAVTATSTSANTITLQAPDTGLTVTVNVNNSTQWDDSLSLATLQTGTAIEVKAQLQSDGTLVALEVQDVNGGVTPPPSSRTGAGIVTSVSLSSGGALQSFTMITRTSTDPTYIGKKLTVAVGSSTVFKDTNDAKNAGMSAFSASNVFAGSAVWVTGTYTTDPQSIGATMIRPATISTFGLVNGTVGASSGGVSIPLLMDANTNFAEFAGMTSATIDTNANTMFDGDVTASNVSSLTSGSPLVVNGYAIQVNSALTVYAVVVNGETR